MKNPGKQNNHETHQQKILLFSENQLTIALQHPATCYIRLTDRLERVVYEISVEVREQGFTLDLSQIALKAGAYLVEVTSDKESHLLKISKK